MSIVKKSFGVCSNGEEASLYELTNSNGMKVVITDFGANIVKILVPDANGVLADVALGFETVQGYEDNAPGCGSFIGRNANRIKDARFEINGKVYQLEVNDGTETLKVNNLHSGSPMYNKVMYEVETFEDENGSSVELTRMSPDMEQGFPGNLNLSVTYTLTEQNELLIEYFAVSDEDTVVNLTNHSYFNLAGHKSGSILNHEVMIRANAFTPTDDLLIPTGEIVSVEGTPMDFRTMKPIGRDINADYVPLKQGKGYDHNYVLDKETEDVELCAKLYEPTSKRYMEVYTDLPGLQFYTGNSLEDPEPVDGKEGAVYHARDGVCFETQFFPNACNEKNFQSTILRKGEEYSYATIYKFGVEE